jgi:hypothetical protein
LELELRLDSQQVELELESQVLKKEIHSRSSQTDSLAVEEASIWEEEVSFLAPSEVCRHAVVNSPSHFLFSINETCALSFFFLSLR